MNDARIAIAKLQDGSTQTLAFPADIPFAYDDARVGAEKAIKDAGLPAVKVFLIEVGSEPAIHPA